MFESIDRSAFGQFVAELWQRQGWQTQIKDDDGRIFVALQRPETGEEGLVWAIADGEVGGQQVQQFRSLCDEYDVGEGAIVTAGTFSEHAEKVAQGTGVELLDGEGIERVLQRKELTGLAEQYGGDGGGGGSDGSPLDAATDLASRAAEATSDVPLVAVVVVVALVGAGVLFGPSVPFLGGGDAISAESTAPEGANASLHVTWNAKVTDSIDMNESDDLVYPAPEGQQLVLVRMAINNTGNGSVPLKQTAFKLRANGTTHANQTLARHAGFLNLPIGPGETVPVWTVFAIPEGESATLVYDQNVTRATVEVEFVRNSDLSVNESQL
ncbi:restriction endonuclease [Halorussus halobius]|uniref:restriction endonuclease n=1 Tax=Halorussus halobius TaxID=1710537 RepID=UPI0010929717|nr:restriction endonuclease [Halorussus halobius]